MIILNVPYEEKDEAKALGAKWNPNYKHWYIEDEADISRFEKWLLLKNDVPTNENILDIINKHKSVCWYPSAGTDFRPLLFLSEAYYDWEYHDRCFRHSDEFNGLILFGKELQDKEKVARDEDQKFPDLFIFTDCGYAGLDMRSAFERLTRVTGWAPTSREGYTDLYKLPFNRKYVKRLYKDSGTEISLKGEAQELLPLEFSPIEDFLMDEPVLYFNRVFYMRVVVKSRELGEWEADVIYAFTQNEPFALKVLLENKINIDYVVVVRYGDSMGGGAVIPGAWLSSILKSLNTKYFIANENYNGPDYEIPEMTSYLNGFINRDISLEKFYEADGDKWGYHGPVNWYRVDC